jgi:tRNA(adenine34) deaminase
MFNNQFMQLAVEMAKQAFLQNEVPIGAIIVDPKTNEITSQSHNLVEKNKDPTAHAEMLAIQSACLKLSSKNLEGLDLYVTLQPCSMCLQALVYAKVRRIYFGAYDPEVKINLTSANHKPEIYGGLMEEDCKELLNVFFANKRSQK